MIIPRVIHRIWLGSEPLPELYRMYGESWRQHHPHWKMRLWTDEDLPPLRDPGSFERARSASERSDVVRFEVLHRHGGLYVDTDVECRKSLEPLIEGLSGFGAYEKPDLVGTGIIGAVPGHPTVARAVEEIPRSVGVGPYPDSTGPQFWTRILAEFPDFEVFPIKLFHPYDGRELYRREGDFPDAYAIHHWSATWRTDEDHRAQVARLQRGRARSEKQLARAERRVDKAERRLGKIEGSAWWRLGSALGRAGGSCRRRASSAIQRLLATTRG